LFFDPEKTNQAKAEIVYFLQEKTPVYPLIERNTPFRNDTTAKLETEAESKSLSKISKITIPSLSTFFQNEK
jgi:hypothetical protein